MDSRPGLRLKRRLTNLQTFNSHDRNFHTPYGHYFYRITSVLAGQGDALVTSPQPSFCGTLWHELGVRGGLLARGSQREAARSATFAGEMVQGSRRGPNGKGDGVSPCICHPPSIDPAPAPMFAIMWEHCQSYLSTLVAHETLILGCGSNLPKVVCT